MDGGSMRDDDKFEVEVEATAGSDGERVRLFMVL